MTWSRASETVPASRVTDSPLGSSNFGYSSEDITRKLKFDRPETTLAPSSSTVISTCPLSNARTMSDPSWADNTTDPSFTPPTSTVTRTTRSKSLPTTVRRLPLSSRCNPDRTWSVPPRPATARRAIENARSRTSRSQRNFTGWSLSPCCFSHQVVVVIGAVDCGVSLIIAGQGTDGLETLVHGPPQCGSAS